MWDLAGLVLADPATCGVPLQRPLAGLVSADPATCGVPLQKPLAGLVSADHCHMWGSFTMATGRSGVS